MGRRRPTPPPKPFDGAWDGLNKLENAVVCKLTDVTWSVEDCIRWMFDDNVVDRLQAAFPYVRALDQGETIHETMLLPIAFPTVSCTFYIGAKRSKMLVPEKGNARNDDVRFGAIRHSLEQAHHQHLQFEKVRKVVRWLNENATIGASRHYCPWLTSILPHDHEFQTASGLTYREPAVSMNEIIPVMRECGAIMASALLCGDLDSESSKNLVSVAFGGSRDQVGAYTSQAFGLR